MNPEITAILLGQAILLAIALYFFFGRSKLTARIADPQKRLKTDKLIRWAAPALVALGILSAMLSISHWEQRHAAQEVISELAAIPQELGQAPAGLPRAELFLHRLESVPMDSAPSDLRRAVRDYTAAVRGGINVMKSGGDVDRIDAEMAQAKKRLAVVASAYQ